MTREYRGLDSDRLIVARLSGAAQRHARWGDLDDAQTATGAAELREIAGNRPDLLAEVAGIMVGWAEGKGPEYEAKGQGVAELCRAAGADESLIPGWVEEGRRRANPASDTGVLSPSLPPGGATSDPGPSARLTRPQ
jgi:hypothetical protein